MLKRLAAVLWWIGLASVLMAVGPVVVNFFYSLDCPQVIAAAQEAAAATQRWEKAHPNWEDRALAALQQQPQGASALDRTLQGLVQTDGAASADLDARAKECRRGPDLGLVFLWGLATAALWALAFVLGGRFWLPPKARQVAE